MTYTGASLADGEIPSAKGTIYTSTGVVSLCSKLTLKNKHAVTQTIKIYAMCPALSGVSVEIGPDIVLETGEAYSMFTKGETHIMSASDEIEAETTTANAVDFHLSGGTE